MVRYLEVMSRFTQYSYRNLLLILTQNPDSNRVMGYQSWEKIGRFVKKETTAIRIWAPMKIKEKQDQRCARASGGDISTDSEPHLKFRPVCVFDISQTEGEPMPDLNEVSGEPGVFLEKLKRFAIDQGIRLDYSEDIRGDGVSKCGEILIRPGLDPAVESHVLAHEIIHSRDKRKELSKVQKETEAEAVAYVVSRSIGLDTGQCSSDYIQLYDGNKETVSNSLQVIQQTAALITKSLFA